MSAPYQNLNHPAWRVMIVGQSGNGKSTFWNRAILNAPHGHRFVFDHEGEFSHRNGLTPAAFPEGLDASLATGWTVFDPSEMFAGRLEDAFSFFCEWVFEVAGRRGGTKLFACDEIQLFTEPGRTPHEFLKVIQTGRRRGIDALFISQASNQVHNGIRNKVTEIVAFKERDENAVKFLRDQGFDEAAIRALQKGEFILRNDRCEQRGNVFAFPPPGAPGAPPGKFVTTILFDTPPLLHQRSGEAKISPSSTAAGSEPKPEPATV